VEGSSAVTLQSLIITEVFQKVSCTFPSWRIARNTIHPFPSSHLISRQENALPRQVCSGQMAQDFCCHRCLSFFLEYRLSVPTSSHFIETHSTCWAAAVFCFCADSRGSSRVPLPQKICIDYSNGAPRTPGTECRLKLFPNFQRYIPSVYVRIKGLTPATRSPPT
jgi:hypothetical protein